VDSTRWYEKLGRSRPGYREGGSFTHEGKRYDLDRALGLADQTRTRRFHIKDLAWVLKYDKPDPVRVQAADLKAPVLVTQGKYGLTVVDGIHRLAKASERGRKTLPGRLITLEKEAAREPRPSSRSPPQLSRGGGGATISRGSLRRVVHSCMRTSTACRTGGSVDSTRWYEKLGEQTPTGERAPASNKRRLRLGLLAGGGSLLAALALRKPVLRAITKPGPTFIRAQSLDNESLTLLRNGQPAPLREFLRAADEISLRVRVPGVPPVWERGPVRVYRRGRRMSADVYSKELDDEGRRSLALVEQATRYGTTPEEFGRSAYDQVVRSPHFRGRTFDKLGEVSGHWRRLPPGQEGHDQTGNQTTGRTWVRRSRMKAGFEPKPHQQKYLRAVREQKGTLALHGTGTGKTFSAIAAFEELKDSGDARRALVIAPAGLRSNFLHKGINKFTDSKGVILKKPQELDDDVEYAVISYAAFRQNPQGWIDAVRPDTIIADEVHKAGNPSSSTYKALMGARQQVPRFMGLTASAVQNEPADLVPLLQLATAGGHPIQSKTEFRKEYMRSEIDASQRGVFGGKVRKQKVVNVERLKQVVGPSIHYVEDLDATEKPVKEAETVEVPMSEDQIRLYRMSMRGIDPKIVDKIKRGEPVGQKEAMTVFTKLLRARQVSSSLSTVDPSMSLEEAAEMTPKIKKVLDDATEHIESTPDAQVIMYSNFYRGGVDVLKAGLSARGISFGVFAGRGQQGVTEQSRQDAVDNYLEGKKKVIIITSAGAEGLSLGNTTMVQLVDGHYNPEKMAQAEARGIRAGGLSHRPQEERRVRVKRYVSSLPKTFWEKLTFQPAEVSVGQWVYRTAKKKERLNRQVREVLEDRSRHEERRRDSTLYRTFVRNP